MVGGSASLPALTIAELCRRRWQVEPFFKRIKQHLGIKTLFGTSDNAVRTRPGSPFLSTC